MSRIAALGAVASVACALVLALIGGAHAAEQPDPRRMPPGAESTVPHLQDGVIRVGSVRILVRVQEKVTGQQLLGRSGKEWLVASQHSNRITVHAVRSGRPPRVVPGGRVVRDPGVQYGVRLSRGGQLLVWTAQGRGGARTTVVRLSDGKRLGIGPWDYEDNYPSGPPLDARGNRLVVAVGSSYTWNPTTDRTRRIASGAASGALMADDVIFVEKERFHFGPTSISDPGVPRWTAKYFAPHDVSPNGALVLGRQRARSHGRSVLQLRRMSDGTLLRSWAYGRRDAVEHSARFENDTRVVFEVHRGGGSALVRCRVKGPCTRASALGGTVSFAHEP